MGEKAYFDELARAFARPEADQMCRHLDALAQYDESGTGERPFEAFEEINLCYHDDPEKAFAYVILGAWRSDNPKFLAGLGCGPLEDILEDPTEELLHRIVAEARKSARFRWLLSYPFKVAIATTAWDAIERFRSTGPHEEPSAGIPPRGG